MKLHRYTLLGTFACALLPTPTHAFCRTTTTNPTTLQTVERDADGCIVEGRPLYWAQSCIPMGVHEDGSPKLGLSFEEARQAVEEAWSVWEDVECEDGTVQLSFVDRGEMHCDEVEFLEGAELSNNNILFFRDAEWPYSDGGSMSMLTTLTFLSKTGEILDADVEVNSAEVDFGANVDLKTALIHEFGHVLGLSHSTHEESVMLASFAPEEQRHTLGADDIAGICSMAGGGRPVSCEPEEVDVDFTRECATLPVAADCAFGGKPFGNRAWLGAVFVVGCGIARRRRRRA